MENRTNRKAYDVYEDLRSHHADLNEDELIKVFCHCIDYSIECHQAKKKELQDEVMFWQNKYNKLKETTNNADRDVELLRYVIEDLSLTIRALTGDRPSQE